MIHLDELAEAARKNAIKRQRNGANIKSDSFSLLKHTATEVIEAMNAYDVFCYRRNLLRDENHLVVLEAKDDLAGELADIVACVMIIANTENISLEHAIENCIEKNRKRAEGTGDKK